jgi:hypothetical protein
VFVFALAGVLAVFLLARQLAAGNDWGGVFAVLLLLHLREFVTNARLIMTDVPTTTLGLLGGLLYLRMHRASATVAPRDSLLAGSAIALAFGFRPLAILLLLPFVALLLVRWREQRRRAGGVSLLLLLLPPLVIGVLTAVYNEITFGDWKRNGYNYWCSLPCDYLSLSFSPRYLGSNLASLGATQSLAAALLGTVGALLLWRRGGAAETLRAMGTYFALGALPITLLHLFFFYAHLRYHVLTMVVLCVLGGAGMATLVPEALKRRGGVWLPTALIVLALLLVPRQPIPPTHRRERAEGIMRGTPPDALIVTSLDPVYLEPLVVRGTSRRLLPVSRDVEYATKVITPRKVPLTEPISPALARAAADRYIPQLRRPGTRLVIPFTADEAPDKIAAMVRSGVPVYVESPGSQPWLDAFTLHPVAGYPWLVRLQARPSNAVTRYRGSLSVFGTGFGTAPPEAGAIRAAQGTGEPPASGEK